MDTESLSYKTLKNASYGFVGFTWPILFSIFITPVIVRRLGIVDFGVYVLVGTITGFVGLLDLGLTVALLKYMAEDYGRGDIAAMQKSASTALSLFILIGLLGLLLFCLLGVFFLPLFHITGLNHANIFVVFVLAGLVFFVGSAVSVYAAIINALQRYDISTKINLVQQTLFNLAMLAAVLLGYKLKVILGINLLFWLLLSWAYIVSARRLIPGMVLRLSWDFKEIKKLYTFGFFSSLANVANSSLNQLDRLIIPIFLGPGPLAYYSLPGNVAQKTNTVVSSLGVIILPLVSGLSGRNEPDRLRTTYTKIIRNLTVVAAAVTAAIMVFGYKILFFWLNKEFADKGFRVLQILAVTYFILSLYGIISHFLLGMGKVKFFAGWAIGLAILNLGLLLLLLPKFGILGAAWAYLGGILPVIILMLWLEKRYLGFENIGRFYMKLYAKIIFNSAIFYLVVHYFVLKVVNSLPALVVIGPLSVLFYLGLYRVLGFFEPEDLEVFRGFGRKILEKFKLRRAT